MFEDLIFDNKDGLSGRKKENRLEFKTPDLISTQVHFTTSKGEGIFIQFDDEELSKWEKSLDY